MKLSCIMLIYLWSIVGEPFLSQFIVGKVWRYQRGNQKPKSKDRQYNG